jgi:hypothetical protein
LVLQTSPRARLLYSNTPDRFRRQPPPAPPFGELGEPPMCGALPERGRLMGRGLDWALMECPRGL